MRFGGLRSYLYFCGVKLAGIWPMVTQLRVPARPSISMKRIEFIAPVEAMRGNLSGKQDLLYAENDNKAYESPAGSVNYARNYRPSFIGVKVSATGKKYFTLKQRSAIHMTSKAKKAMAVLGGAGSLYASLVRTKSSAIYVAIYAQWLALQDLGSTSTFREWVTGIFMKGLRTKVSQFAFTGPNNTSYVKNPWMMSEQTEGCGVSQPILWKFYDQLAAQPVNFYIDGIKGYAQQDNTFSAVASLNQGIFTLTEGENGLLLCNGVHVKLGDNTVEWSEEIVTNGEYVTTGV